MSYRISIYFTVAIACFLGFVRGQDVVTETEFLTYVLENHPVSKQANLQALIGESKLLKARGGFDPKLFSDFNQKQFDDKNYFRKLDAGVKIPTWLGAEIKGGYELNNGQFLNSENSVPNNGLWAAGVEVPLLNGLIIDNRRAALQQGKIYAELGETEKLQTINNLLLEARNAYWDWFMAAAELKIAQQGLDLTSVRINAVKVGFQQGDKAAVDTLEAFIQYQNRVLFFQEVKLKEYVTKRIAETYLWIDRSPASLTENASPQLDINYEEMVNVEMLERMIDSLAVANPDLQIASRKIDLLEVDRKLKREFLKPNLSIGYNFLNQPLSEAPLDNFSIDNFKWNVNFSMPLIFRKERGDFKIATANLEIARLEFDNKLYQQQNKLRISYNKALVYLEQLTTAQSAANNYQLLLDAENKKFRIGSSSLFLINSREQNYLKTQQKVVEIKTKLQKAFIDIDFILGNSLE